MVQIPQGLINTRFRTCARDTSGTFCTLFPQHSTPLPAHRMWPLLSNRPSVYFFSWFNPFHLFFPPHSTQPLTVVSVSYTYRSSSFMVLSCATTMKFTVPSTVLLKSNRKPSCFSQENKKHSITPSPIVWKNLLDISNGLELTIDQQIQKFCFSLQFKACIQSHSKVLFHVYFVGRAVVLGGVKACP